MTKAATNTKAPELHASVLDDLRQLARTAPVLARRQGWDYLRESVSPSAEQRMWMYCRDRVREMKDEGDLPNAVRLVTHVIDFRSVAERKIFAVEIEKKGFTTMISANLPLLFEDGSPDPSWKADRFILKIQREDCVSLSYIFHLVCEILDILSPFDAVYQGWSAPVTTFVASHPLADQILLA